MSEPADVPGPRELFERMRRHWLGDAAVAEEHFFAEDVVIEMPFATPGGPRRIEGRENFLAFAAPRRAALPVRFEDIRYLAVHETADPEVIIVEYEMEGTVTTTGRRAAAPFIGILRARDGRVTHWREYQNAMAIAEALGQPAPPADSGG